MHVCGHPCRTSSHSQLATDGPVITQTDLYLLKPNLQIHPILTKSHNFILIFNLLTGAYLILLSHALHADAGFPVKDTRGDSMNNKPTATTHSMQRTSLPPFPGCQLFTSLRNVLHGAPRYGTSRASHSVTYVDRCIKSEWTCLFMSESLC